MNYFLIGIKGTGMSALAKILYDKGNVVVGSDYEEKFFTEEGLGFAKIYPFNTFLDNYIYIIGNAFVGSNDHIEVIKRGYENYKYNEFISMLEGIHISISGTHGKTTTTSLITKIFCDEKIDYLIGDGNGKGILNNDYFIYEACEYKEHFLAYSPNFLVINNIDYEHTDFYSDLNQYINAFQKLVYQSNIVLANGDCQNCRKLKGDNIIWFGYDSNNDYVISVLDENFPKKIKIKHNNISYYFNIPFYGEYMVYNAACAIITGLIHNISDIQKKLYDFKFPKRRMEEYVINGYTIIDDYAHHPTEIENTIKAIKEKYNKEICLVFEPHMYSRTVDLLDDFIRVLSKQDVLFIKDVFTSVREKKGGNVNFLINKLSNAKYFTNIDELKVYKDRIIVFMGAGKIYENIFHFYENQ